MIKINSNKYGTIQIEDNCLKKNIKDSIVEVISEKKLVNIVFEIKKNILKKVEIFFKKSTNLSMDDQKSLYDQITFLLSMRYGINNSLIIFNYEN